MGHSFTASLPGKIVRISILLLAELAAPDGCAPFELSVGHTFTACDGQGALDDL